MGANFIKLLKLIIMAKKQEKVSIEYSLLPIEEVQEKCISQLEFARRKYKKGSNSKDYVMAKQLIDMFGSLAYYLVELKNLQDETS